MAMSRPRIRRKADSGSDVRFVPSNTADPPSIRPAGCGSSRRMARFVTLLPQPDSPTRPSASPGSTVNDTPLTAWTTSSWVRNRTTRSRTSSSGITVLSPLARIERFAYAVAEQVEANYSEDDRRAREEEEVWSDAEEPDRVGEHDPPLRGTRIGRAEAEKSERCDSDDRRAQAKSALDDHRSEGIRQHVAHEDAHARRSGRPSGDHVVDLAQAEDASAQQPREDGCVGDSHGEHNLPESTTQPRNHANRQQHAGHCEQRVHEAHDDGIQPATEHARDGPQAATDEKSDGHGNDTGHETDPGAEQHATEYVTSLEIGAHQ